MALKITENIIIDDIDEVISRMQELIGPETFDINSMMNFIENEKATKFYFDQKMQGRSEGDRAAVYLWLDTGYVSQRDRTIFISLLKNEYNGTFVGSWVGDYYRLFNNAAKFFASNRNGPKVRVINYKYKEFGQAGDKAYDGKYYFFRLNEMDAGNYKTHTQKYK